MSARDLFVSSPIPWFADHADEVIDAIANESGISRDMFRRDNVRDATLRQRIPAAAQKLIRWSDRGPEEIFVSGFLPTISPQNDGPGSGSEPTAPSLPSGACNLRRYVRENPRSIFISTTQPYRNTEGNLAFWQRRVTHRNWRRYEYDIFAYGGIAVNRVLGRHAHQNQHEIAFPGGIRPEMVRYSREFLGPYMVRAHVNPYFDIAVNPPHLPALITMLPTYPPADLLVLHPCFFGDTDDDDAPHGLAVQDDHAPQGLAVQDDDDDDQQYLTIQDDDEDWEQYLDVYNISPLPLTGVACVLQPSDPSQAYVFCANRYVIIRVVPGTMGDTTARDSKIIVNDWPSLYKTGFAGKIDAVLPSPDNDRLMYFFAMENYAVIYADPGTPNDEVIDGPKSIREEWASLRSAGFNTVDAVLPNPVDGEQAYFFRGDQYVLIHVQQGPNKSYIVDGPNPIWPCLNDAGFKEIAMILLNPSNSNQAYVFSKEVYALINIGRSPSDIHIVDGPKAIHTGWPLLRQVCFL